MDELALFQIVFSLSAILVYMVSTRAIRTLMLSYANAKKTSTVRVTHILKYLNGVMMIVFVIIVLAVWGIDYKGLLVFASSILAILGVALFAQWSLLSNITAGVIIFFSFPARIGDKVEIIDGKEVLTGTIVEINIFQILLKDDQGFEISYPNSLILQRPVRNIGHQNQKDPVVSLPKIKTRLKQR